MSFLSRSIIILHPVRCHCGKIFSVPILNKYINLKKTDGHLSAAISCGFVRECCLSTLICPRQIQARTEEQEFDDFPAKVDQEIEDYHPPLMIRAAKTNIPPCPWMEPKPRKFQAYGIQQDIVLAPVQHIKMKFELPPPPQYRFPTLWENKKFGRAPEREIEFVKRDIKTVILPSDVRGEMKD